MRKLQAETIDLALNTAPGRPDYYAKRPRHLAAKTFRTQLRETELAWMPSSGRHRSTALDSPLRITPDGQLETWPL